MNKTDLANELAERVNLTKFKATEVVNELIDVITQAVANGDKITLLGFGTFEAVKKAPRVGRNPKSGKEIQIPATIAPKFVVGKNFKEVVLAKSKLKPKAKAKK